MPADESAIENVLVPYTHARQGASARLVTHDGEADCHGLGEGSLMINHASGEAIWNLVVEVAGTANNP